MASIGSGLAASALGGPLAGIATMGFTEASALAGGAYQDALDKGAAPEEASKVADRVFATSVPLYLASDALGPFSRLGGKGLTQHLARGVLTGIGEGLVEEPVEPIIEKAAWESRDKGLFDYGKSLLAGSGDYGKNVAEVGPASFASGMLLGAGGSVVQNATQMTPGKAAGQMLNEQVNSLPPEVVRARMDALLTENVGSSDVTKAPWNVAAQQETTLEQPTTDWTQAAPIQTQPVKDGVTAVPVSKEQLQDPVSSTGDAVQALLTQAEVSSANPEVKQGLANLGVAYHKARTENNAQSLETTSQKLEELLEQKGLEAGTRKALTQAREVLGRTEGESTGRITERRKTPWQELREIHNTVARGLAEAGQSVQQAKDNATIYMNYLMRRTERLKSEGQNVSVGQLHKMQVVPGKQSEHADRAFAQALPMELQKDFLQGLNNEQRGRLETDYNRWGETLDILTGKKETYSDGSALDVSKPITILSKTPAALGLAGAKEDLPVVIRKSTITKKALGAESREEHSHGLTPEEVAQIPAALVDPLIVMEPTADALHAKPGSLIVVTGIVDGKGRPVLVPLQLSEKRQTLEVNLASSVYGKEHFKPLLEKASREKTVRYVNESALPKVMQGSLGHKGAGGMQSSEELNSEQRISRRSDLVKRWLSDDTFYQTAWHGSQHRFDSFDLGAVGTGAGGQVHGWGLYFAQDKNSAMRYRPGPQQGADLLISGKDSLDYYNNLERQANRERDRVKREVLYNRLALVEDLMVTWDVADVIENGLELENPEVDWFKKEVASQVSTTKGSTTQVDIPESDVLLDEQKTLAEQSKDVRKAAKELTKELGLRLSKNTTGEQFYGLMVEALGSGKAASQKLNESGVKGVTYDDNQDGRGFVVFNDKAIQVIEQYNQKAKAGRRGSIEFRGEGQAIVRLFEKADGSTFAHEATHLMLHDLINDGLTAAPSSHTRALLNQAVGYLGIGNLDLANRQNFTADEQAQFQAAHEKFSRSFEAYLREGVAPSRGLLAVFRRMKEELLRIYKDLRNLGVKLSPEIRGLFDELLSGKRQEWVVEPAKQIGTGDFGPIWGGYKNDPNGAIDVLMDKKAGEVQGAAFRQETGPIDFVYGTAGDPQSEYAGGYGLAHIEAKHGPEALTFIPEIIASGSIVHKGSRIEMHAPDGMAVVRLDWDGKAKTWLVSSFFPNTQKDPRPSRTSTIAGQKVGGSMAPPNASLSTRTITPTPTEGKAEGVDFSATGDLWGGAPDMWNTAKQKGKAKQKMRGEDFLESLGLERATEGATDEPTPDLAAMIRSGSVHFDESKLAPDDGKARPQESLKRLRDITSALGQIVPLRTGSRFKGAVQGYYTPNTEVARMRHKNDIQTALHEVGHALDYKLRLRESAGSHSVEIAMELQKLGKATSPPDSDGIYLRNEGIAEFFRTYATNPAEAKKKAPRYTEVFEMALAEESETAQTLRPLLAEIFESVRGYYGQTDTERMRANRMSRGDRVGVPLAERVKQVGEDFRRHFDDGLRPLQRVQEMIYDAVKEHSPWVLERGKYLPDSMAPYHRARTTPGFQGRASKYIDALKKPLEKIGTEGYAKVVDYLTAAGAMDYWANGMNPAIDMTEAGAARIIRKASAETVEIARKVKEAYDVAVDELMVVKLFMVQL